MSHLEKKIRLLIVDDHPVVRTGLSTMLQKHREIHLIGDAGNGAEAISMLSHSAADIVLLDLRMPGMTGIDVLKRIRIQFPATKTIILSSFELDEEIHQAVNNGARGYLLKDTQSEEMLEAIRRVQAGGTYFPKRITNRLSHRQMRPDLSKREIEILELVAQGLTNKEVAKTLNLSQFTVRNHLNNITSKLEVSDRTEAAFVAFQAGIISVTN